MTHLTIFCHPFVLAISGTYRRKAVDFPYLESVEDFDVSYFKDLSMGGSTALYNDVSSFCTPNYSHLSDGDEDG